jgi:hypothetical protein
MLRLLGEALTVDEAVERANVSPESAARLLSALQALELVEEWSPGVEQFRSRIRHEKQRHAEELSAVLMEARQRESRMLEAFEKALGSGGGKLQVSLDEPAVKASTTNKSFGGGAPSFSSSAAAGASGSAAPSPAATAATATTPTGGGMSFSSSASPATAARPPISSTTVGGTSAGGGGGSNASIAVSGGSNSSNSSAVTVVEKGSDVAPAPAVSNGKRAEASQNSMSLADVKYREGVEQAASNRLDEAEVTLREAVRLDASKPEYLTALARVLLANPRYERSGTLPVVRSLLDRAVTLAPDNAEATQLHQEVMKEMG